MWVEWIEAWSNTSMNPQWIGVYRDFCASLESNECMAYRALHRFFVFRRKWEPNLLMLQLLIPNSSNLPCLYSTFHLEYPLVLSRFCLWLSKTSDAEKSVRLYVGFPGTSNSTLFLNGLSRSVMCLNAVFLLKHSVNTRHESIFSDPDVVKELSRLHENFVVVPADKASNNYTFDCKRYYVDILIEELGLHLLILLLPPSG